MISVIVTLAGVAAWNLTASSSAAPEPVPPDANLATKQLVRVAPDKRAHRPLPHKRKHPLRPPAPDPPIVVATTPAPSPTTSATAPASGDVWSCVAQSEEGGSNSTAGYFGTIYPPSSYPGGDAVAAQYGDSWLSVPYSVQLSVAQQIQAAYGWSAWGVLTRERCGLG